MVQSDIWYKVKCPKCGTVNWVYGGWAPDPDISKLDVDSFECFSCGHVESFLPEDEDLLDIMNTEKGSRFPFYSIPKVKGCNWKFTKYLPDEEDITAALEAMNSWFKLNEEKPIPSRSEVEFRVDSFSAGFTRGMKWILDKFGISS